MSGRLFALIACAGRGTRAGGDLPKQYQIVAGYPLLHYSLRAFEACSELTQTLVVLAPEDRDFDKQRQRFKGLSFAVRYCGGATRQASVLNGLGALAAMGATDEDWVLVHDAARGGITPALIRTLIKAVYTDSVGGILALPVTDTLKQAQAQPNANPNLNPKMRCVATLPRENFWLAQTPQMFKLGLLREALAKAARDGRQVSDEANAIEALGYQPQLVLGASRNFKLTYPRDFECFRRFALD